MFIHRCLQAFRISGVLVGCLLWITMGHLVIVWGQEVPSGGGELDRDHIEQRNAWFYRGRLVRGRPAAALRHRAYRAKIGMRAQRAGTASGAASGSTAVWTPLGPVPLASDATGNGTQDYGAVTGRATAVAIDPADPTGNTVYVGGAQSGVWKSSNAAGPAASVMWSPLTDNQATLSIGAIAIQPGNVNPANSVVLAATGEADSSADSYFGLGILRSADAGNTWTLISTANGGALSFSGLGGARMAFGAGTQANTVVAAMATTSQGWADGAVTSSTMRGLYTSADAGLTWTYDALSDPGGASDATSATSVVYNASANSGNGLFFAAIRYHGLYSSLDGVNWTRLSAQPGGAVLSTSACPPQSTSNGYACPIYRAELSVVPGRNEMYAWFVYFSGGSVVDGGIWQSKNGGASWTAISDSGITNCGDGLGCGVQQGAYNLELLAVPAGSTATDLYAGAINLYKCSLTVQNPSCTATPFLNLTHVYGCNPIGAPAHVHPDQHAMAFQIPAAGGDSGGDLMFFANDGGLYRALDGFGGLTSGSCSGTNQFDDLNQSLGSMTQFVSFSQHPSDPGTLLGGTQDNGSPATSQAGTSLGWGNVLGGDGGYNAIDANVPTNFYATNPDVPPGGLGVQVCGNGANCNNGGFSFVATSSMLGGDDGGFYFPFMLDLKSPAMIVGTCRIWRGSRTGGPYTALSPNSDTLGSDTCSGSEVNQVRAIAAGGPTDSNGSQVIYATTSGLGPIDGPLNAPVGGRVWVTTNATAGPTAFADVTENGPTGSINPNQFPIADVALDPTDATGKTAYVAVMGFTGGPGHVWKTTNAGATWTDLTGNLPDSPVNALVVDPELPILYAGSDVGVFASSTTSATWTEVGPTSGPGLLPNVAVTALGIFDSGSQELLRASTYGRGVWQYPLLATPSYLLSISNSPLTIFSGQVVPLEGTATAVNGYASSIALSCSAGTTAPPTTCSPKPSSITPAQATPFAVTLNGADGDYSFEVHAVGVDSKHVTENVPVVVHIISFALTTPTPAKVTVPRGTTSPPVNFQVTAANSFNQAVTLTCNLKIANTNCALTPGTSVNPTANNPVNMTANVTVPPTAATGNYPVTIQASSAGVSAVITTLFTISVTTNPDFVLKEPSGFPEVNVGSAGTSGPITISAQDGFTGTVALSCPTTYGAGSCSVSPASVSSFPATATLTINGTSFTAGSYSLSITGTSGSVTHTLPVPFDVGDYTITGTQSLNLAPGGQGTANLTLTSISFYTGQVQATCDASALSGATCTVPANSISVASGGTASLPAVINVPNTAASGSYNIKISTQDTSGAPSHNFTVAVTVGQDFELSSSTASQTVSAGQSTGPYNLTIRPVGAAFNGAVTVSCSGLPSLSQCAFNPPTPVTPGPSPANVILTVTTTAPRPSASRRGDARLGLWFWLPGILLAFCVPNQRGRRMAPSALFLLTVFYLALLPSCGGVSQGGGGGGQPGTPPGTYTIRLTGASPGTPADAGQSAQVTLVVN